jgi:hypothetical protein
MPEKTPPLPPASLRLLKLLAEHDTGEGVHFDYLTRNRWRHPHTGETFVGRTFWPLERAGLVNPGSNYEPARILEAGRAYLTALGTDHG